MNIIIFFVILLILVLVHEFGHFYSAKKFGIRVDEFGFGFPPKIFSIKKGETEYSFNALPFGGFVKIFGENPDDENTNGPDRDRSFVHKAKWKQAIVLFAGVFANFILAWFLISFGFLSGFPTSVGSEPKNYTLQDIHLVVVSVSPKSPAEFAGLKSGDKITLVSSNNRNDVVQDITPENLKSFILSHPNKKIEIGYLRGNDKTMNLTEVTPLSNDFGRPTIGISMDTIGIAKLPFFLSFWEGMKLTLNVTKNTAIGLYSLIIDGLRGKGSLANIAGPVGIVGIVGDAYKLGFSYLLSFTALISINLAIINLLPFPALDGGRLFFLLIEKIKGSRINPKVANITNMVGFAILIGLMLLVTYNDVVKLF